MWTAVALAVAVLVDVIGYRLGGSTIKGVDYLVLAVIGAFLLGCLLAGRLAGRFSLAFLSMALVIGVVELALSIASLGHSRPYPWYVWPPGYARRTTASELVGVAPDGRFTINSSGIRGPEFSDRDRYRILCIGGSTTECLYLDDAKTWPHLLAQRIAQQTEGVWVGNVGRSGLNSRDHVTLVENLPEVNAVDCWVVLCGINDLGQQLRGVYDEMSERTFTRTFSYRRPGLFGSLCRPFHRNLLLVDWLEQWRKRTEAALDGAGSDVYQDRQAAWVAELREARRQAKKVDTLPPLEPFLQEYERQLMSIVRLSRDKQVRLVFMTQPNLLKPDMPAELDHLILGGELADGTYLTTAARIKAIGAYNRRMLEVCAREGVECIDLAAELPKSTDVFYDDVHFNESGAHRVAKIAARALARPESLAVRHDETRRR